MDDRKLSDEELFFGKLTKCVLLHGFEIVYNVCKDLYYNHPSSDKGNIDLYSFLKKFGVTEKKIESLFLNIPKTFKFNYSANKPNETLDICFCAYLIDHLIGHDKCFESENGKMLLKSLNEIRKIRGEVCKNVKKQKLESFKEDLVKEIEQVCNEMDKIFEEFNYERPDMMHANGYKNLGEKVIKKIRKTWESNVRMSLSEYNILKNKENEENFRVFVSGCCQELAEDVYKKLYSTPSFLLQNNDFDFSVEEAEIPMPLLVNGDKVQYQDIFAHKSKKKETAPTVIIVHGDAGYGKSTLCKKFALEWCELWNGNSNNNETSSCSPYDLVLLVEVKRARENGFCQYLKEILLPNSLCGKKEKEVYSFLERLNILIIIDGYDEKSKEAHKLFSSLLKVLGNKTILITTRPLWVDEIASELKEHNHLYLNAQMQGFDDDNTRQFATKIWKILQTKCECGNVKEFLEYLKKLPRDFQDILKAPLMNTLLIYLWVTNKEKSKPLQTLTTTNLYKEIVNLQKSCIVNKIKQNLREVMNYEYFEEVINDFIEMFAEHYFKNKGIENGVIDNALISSFQKELKKKGLNEIEYLKIILSSLFLFTPCIRNYRKMKKGVLLGQYEFLHKTQMEFLIAHHVVSIITRENSYFNLDNLEIPLFKSENIQENIGEFSFVLGLLNIEGKLKPHIKTVYSILEKNHSSDYVLLWKILRETMSEKNSSDLGDRLKPNSELEKCVEKLLRMSLNWKLDDETVVSALNLLRYISVTPKNMVIDISDDPDNISMFFFKLCEIKKILKDRKINVDLYLRNHLKSGKESSDKYLTCLEPWANLSIFHGHLEEKGIEFLHSCKNLTQINVRITSVTALKSFNDMCKEKNRLTKICIIFDEPFSSVPKLHDFKGDISITVNSVRDVQMVPNMFKKLKPETANFAVISMNFSEEIKSKAVKTLLLNLKSCTYKKLKVEGVPDISDDDYLEFKERLDGLKLIWNSHGI